MLATGKKILCVRDGDATDYALDILDPKVLGRTVIAQCQKTLDATLDFSTSSNIALEDSEALLLYAWQELNTGKWASVDGNWHKVYAAASWMKAVSYFRCNMDSPTVWSDIVKLCDMGHLMGGDVWNGILIRTISNAEEFIQSQTKQISDSTPESSVAPLKRLKASLRPSIQYLIPEVCQPYLSDFQDLHFRQKRSVVLKHCMDDWPALEKWSPEYIRQLCGSRTVPVEIGRRYTDDDWTQELMTIGAFIDKYIYMKDNPEHKIAYLAQHDLFSQAPVLKEDIAPPDYIAFCGDDDPDMNAWFGPEGTVSPLHYDPKHNFLCQVMGEKYVRLYSESQTEFLYPHAPGMLNNTSQVDVENPDLSQFPAFEKASFYEYILEPGDILYIPPREWHFIRSLSISFSVSFWFNESKSGSTSNL
ncbi:hypothetical protein RvY_02754 [Ramazzottius varieornatus]|uniref:JmjC domain-containing protein 5 n=1 Tax=Ramazzottius varieornatus TaxID=947166 RepID=A0A1D1UVD0_RAMVA|nr:hypothetical protein RvY_02754 [Ramazzottius varieornatus]